MRTGCVDCGALQPDCTKAPDLRGLFWRDRRSGFQYPMSAGGCVQEMPLQRSGLEAPAH